VVLVKTFIISLRESGAIEQDADIVSFLYRPEYYKIDEWDDDEASPTAGQAEIMIAKHRNGSIENVRLKFMDTSGSLIIWRILVEVMMIYHQV
jgi:replicative DNA helicase